MPAGRAAAIRARRDFKRDLKVNITAYRNDWGFLPPRHEGGVADEGSGGRQAERGRTRDRENISQALLGKKGQDAIGGAVRFQTIHMVWIRIKIAWKNSSWVELRDS